MSAKQERARAGETPTMVGPGKHRLYFLGGVEINVQCEGRECEEEIERFFAPLALTGMVHEAGSACIELRCVVSDTPAKIPQSKSEPASCYDLSLIEGARDVCLTDGSSAFQICRGTGKGFITLHSSFWAKGLLSKQNFFLIGLIYVLAPLGFYDLHGGAVARDDACCLLLGEAGSGKSSLALGLVRHGWNYTSDDAMLLRALPDRIETLSFRKKFFIDPILARRYPEIAPHLEPATGGVYSGSPSEAPSLRPYRRAGAKRFVDLDRVYPGRFRPGCIPKVLIFCSLVPRHESRIKPLDRTSALIQLTKQSVSIFFNRNAARAHLEVLKRLVYQTLSFQFFAGRDVYEAPEKMEQFLSVTA